MVYYRTLNSPKIFVDTTEDNEVIVRNKHEHIHDAIGYGLERTNATEDITGELPSIREYMTSPKYPNLSREEETFYHFIMWEGFNAQQELISSNGNLAEQEYESLVSKIENGRMSFEILFLSVQGLAWSIAQKYHSVETEDMVQQANFAIERAIKSFDPKKGKLSTHATWQIRSELNKHYRKLVSQIPLPAQLHTRVKELKLVTQQLEIKLGRKPTQEELAQEMGVDNGILKKVQKATFKIQSVNEPLSSDSDQTLGDIIEDPSPTPEDQLIDKEVLPEILNALKILNPKDKELVCKAYGLRTEDNMFTFTTPIPIIDIAREFGVTPAYIYIRLNKSMSIIQNNLT